MAIEPTDSNQQMGYKNIFGYDIISPEYDWAGPFGDGGFWKDLAIISKKIDGQGVKYGCIDRWGRERIKIRFESIGLQSEGLVPVAALNSDGKIVGGYNDYNNTMPIPLMFSACEPFSEGLAPVASLEAPWEWGYIKKDFGKTRQMAIPFQFVNACPFKNGKAIVRLRNGSIGIINLEGKVIEIKKEMDFNGDE